MKQRTFAVTEYTFEDVRLLKTEQNRGNGFTALTFADASENDSISDVLPTLQRVGLPAQDP